MEVERCQSDVMATNSGQNRGGPEEDYGWVEGGRGQLLGGGDMRRRRPMEEESSGRAEIRRRSGEEEERRGSIPTREGQDIGGSEDEEIGGSGRGSCNPQT